MYPENKSHQDNHSRNICSDGIRQSPKKVHLVINSVSRNFVEHPPPYPQPKDVFTGGNVFHPVRFMEVVAALYDRVVVNQSPPGALAMHDFALATMLHDRTVTVPGLDGRASKYLFKLFHSFKLAPGEGVVLDDHEGETYLRMDCLSEPPLEVLQDAVGDGQGWSAESA
uniref:ATP-dependent RNA helicase CshA (EC) n=1 Tax=Ganoderma boninense TaxID=34458 RepID=A0A5K1JVM5_9APHY|nr:ATP-dependent RNA helicase CshA (EC [Ganoderma boninense]